VLSKHPWTTQLGSDCVVQAPMDNTARIRLCCPSAPDNTARIRLCRPSTHGQHSSDPTVLSKHPWTTQLGSDCVAQVRYFDVYAQLPSPTRHWTVFGMPAARPQAVCGTTPNGIWAPVNIHRAASSRPTVDIVYCSAQHFAKMYGAAHATRELSMW
jgi:hypothetical protein